MKSNPVESKLKTESKNCSSCTQWIHNCKAACCRVFRAESRHMHKGRVNSFWFHFDKNPDMAEYYRLHNCLVFSGKVFVPLGKLRLEIKDGYHYFYGDCKNLEGNSCKEHTSGNRPSVCKDFDETSGEETNKWFVVPECLANYKRENK